MKRLRDQKIVELLSAYLDDSLPMEDRRFLERRLKEEPELLGSLENLRSVRDALSRVRPIPPNDGMWAKLSSQLVDREKPLVSEPSVRGGLLVPAAVVVGALVFVASMVYIFTRHGGIIPAITETRDRVRTVYVETFGGEWIMPLYRKTTRDHALRFALFGTLDLDEQGTTLHVKRTQRNKLRIDLGKAPTAALTRDAFFRQLEITPRQRATIDTLLELARARIETGVLMDKDRSLLIDPDLATLNVDLLASIASTLEPAQRVRFDRYLDGLGVAYGISTESKLPPASPRVLLQYASAMPARDRRFVVLDRDGALVRRVTVNMDSIQRAVTAFASSFPSIANRIENIRNVYLMGDTTVIDMSRTSAARRTVTEERADPEPARILFRKNFISPSGEAVSVIIEDAERPPFPPSPERSTSGSHELIVRPARLSIEMELADDIADRSAGEGIQAFRFAAEHYRSLIRLRRTYEDAARYYERGRTLPRLPRPDTAARPRRGPSVFPGNESFSMPFEHQVFPSPERDMFPFELVVPPIPGFPRDSSLHRMLESLRGMGDSIKIRILEKEGDRKYRRSTRPPDESTPARSGKDTP
ncbi:MAG: hypothetical protein QHI48_01720 [Bacteroidota bacterium]|nr:hypothetical protein [Bacteroidota bacterium]